MSDGISAQQTSQAEGERQLLGVIAAGELAAVEQLVEDASQASDLSGKVALLGMAAREWAHFEALNEELERRGVDPIASVEKYRPTLEAFHEATKPRNWWESIVKAYVGDALAADFYAEISSWLAPDIAQIVRQSIGSTARSQFVEERVRQYVVANPTKRDILKLWGRLLFGEAVTRAQVLLAEDDDLMELIITGGGEHGGLTAMVDIFEHLERRHGERLEALGLS